MKPVEPILIVELFPPLSRELIKLLNSLDVEDWSKPTACGLWSVKDVASHLLGGSLGRLSHTHADPSQVAKDKLSFEQLVKFIDQENEEWVRAARRINPTLLIKFLQIADAALYRHFKSLPMDSPARTPVSWAGEIESYNWMDIAREVTEKWLHQQHIRQSVGQSLLSSRKWLHPVLDTFTRAMPYAYRYVSADDGSSVGLHITGPAGGDWCLLRQKGGWRLYTGVVPDATTRVEMEQDLAWRLFTKGISAQIARAQIRIDGNLELGEPILHMVSIMA